MAKVDYYDLDSVHRNYGISKERLGSLYAPHIEEAKKRGSPSNGREFGDLVSLASDLQSVKEVDKFLNDSRNWHL